MGGREGEREGESVCLRNTYILHVRTCTVCTAVYMNGFKTECTNPSFR